jgi:signal transduction histidine kinase
MSASFAHELNQPLTAILGYAQLLQDQQKTGKWDPQVSHDVLEDIVQNTERAGDIIRRIRNFIQPLSCHTSTSPPFKERHQSNQSQDCKR